ncbi:hypothetical protein LTR91_002846 [Friedmanniomyces endolithicus]|uniref:Uncharacterized protein n=1 Tax=Friedmanniomyces endolithicus TaxID=329885 RepID=A0AAN6R002_9PEZI|nr:hypothetical protein LTR94_001059 [Friedmanniomyces endolithicus]KAK0813243.1 hypothetical protein LTR38_003039 [Friedmanniomyces endolithicus]KAK0815929.1 hypothetical protein LTR59_000302 [Friedmanniomyces endolithicus]KAK0818062.1 hypothetical protein LTR75_002780 [Friedmanniomyces endolithicus]KAK0843688.1 hypothetical protein LTR03_008501 [Friedmanniomyces endolithicus]
MSSTTQASLMTLPQELLKAINDLAIEIPETLTTLNKLSDPWTDKNQIYSRYHLLTCVSQAYQDTAHRTFFRQYIHDVHLVYECGAYYSHPKVVYRSSVIAVQPQPLRCQIRKLRVRFEASSREAMAVAVEDVVGILDGYAGLREVEVVFETLECWGHVEASKKLLEQRVEAWGKTMGGEGKETWARTAKLDFDCEDWRVVYVNGVKVDEEKRWEECRASDTSEEEGDEDEE